MALNIKKTNNNIDKKLKPKRNLLATVGLSTGIIVLAGGIFFGLSQLLATETYYVLNQNVAAGTLVTPKMLESIETAKNTAPKNAISSNQVKQGTIYTRLPLQAGDVLSASNTGLGVKSDSAIPSDWVVTSFSISSADAVNGNITQGEYFDILGINSEGKAKYLFVNVLALEVTSSTTATTIDSSGKIGNTGDTLQYVVGMPASEAAKLQSAIASYQSIKLIESPSSLSQEKRNTENLNQEFSFDSNSPTDLYEGTDNTFSTKQN